MKFVVGTKEKEFHVHEAVLNKYLTFQKMLEPNKFKEGQERIISLPETDPSTFLDVVEYFYEKDYFPYQNPTPAQTKLGAASHPCKEHRESRKQELYVRSANEKPFLTEGWKPTEETHCLFLRELDVYQFADTYCMDDLQSHAAERINLYPIDLDEIIALGKVISASPKDDEAMNTFFHDLVREKKIGLSGDPRWKDLVETGGDTGLTWEVVRALSC